MRKAAAVIAAMIMMVGCGATPAKEFATCFNSRVVTEYKKEGTETNVTSKLNALKVPKVDISASNVVQIKNNIEERRKAQGNLDKCQIDKLIRTCERIALPEQRFPEVVCEPPPETRLLPSHDLGVQALKSRQFFDACRRMSWTGSPKTPFSMVFQTDNKGHPSKIEFVVEGRELPKPFAKMPGLSALSRLTKKQWLGFLTQARACYVAVLEQMSFGKGSASHLGSLTLQPTSRPISMWRTRTNEGGAPKFDDQGWLTYAKYKGSTVIAATSNLSNAVKSVAHFAYLSSVQRCLVEHRDNPDYLFLTFEFRWRTPHKHHKEGVYLRPVRGGELLASPVQRTQYTDLQRCIAAHIKTEHLRHPWLVELVCTAEHQPGCAATQSSNFVVAVGTSKALVTGF